MTQADPLSVGVTLALMVGVMQFSAGALRLGAFVDYISNPVVLGYITGAGLLIGIGQLPNVTGTLGGQGWLGASLWTWLQGLGATDSLTLIMALSTTILILILRRIHKRIPSAIIALGLATLVSWVFGFHDHGLKTIADLAPIPQGLPPLTLPDMSLLSALFPVAFACTVLS
jgi:MFS superfamily sulfate permease-like transporter